MADTSAIEIPADLAAVAEEKGIPMDIVRRALALGFPADAIKGQMSMPGVTAEAAEALISEQERIRAGGEITIPPELLAISREQAESFIEMQEARASGGPQTLDLAWMKVPTEWGIRVKPGKKGLTVGMINV